MQSDLHLLPGHRATLGLWRHGHRAITQRATFAEHGCLPEAATAALLARLRQCTIPIHLFDWYDSSEEDDVDFALVSSLVPVDLTSPVWWQVRNAAYHLRWREFTAP